MQASILEDLEGKLGEVSWKAPPPPPPPPPHTHKKKPNNTTQQPQEKQKEKEKKTKKKNKKKKLNKIESIGSRCEREAKEHITQSK